MRCHVQWPSQHTFLERKLRLTEEWDYSEFNVLLAINIILAHSHMQTAQNLLTIIQDSHYYTLSIFNTSRGYPAWWVVGYVTCKLACDVAWHLQFSFLWCDMILHLVWGEVCGRLLGWGGKWKFMELLAWHRCLVHQECMWSINRKFFVIHRHDHARYRVKQFWEEECFRCSPKKH